MVIFSRCGKVQHPMNTLNALPSVPGFTFTAKISESVLKQTGTRPTASERWSTVKKVVLSEKSITKTLEYPGCAPLRPRLHVHSKNLGERFRTDRITTHGKREVEHRQEGRLE